MRRDRFVQSYGFLFLASYIWFFLMSYLVYLWIVEPSYKALYDTIGLNVVLPGLTGIFFAGILAILFLLVEILLSFVIVFIQKVQQINRVVLG